MVHNPDNGIKSRKLWYCVGTSLAIIVSSTFVPVASFSEVVWGLICLCLIYTGGNSIVKVMSARFGGFGTSSSSSSTEVKVTKKVEKQEDDKEQGHVGE